MQTIPEKKYYKRKTSISFYASMNEIISPKHSNESKIKTNVSVIFGGDNKGSAVKHKYNFRHVIRTFFFNVEFLFFFLLFWLIRNKNIYVYVYVCENKNTSESQSARSNRLWKNSVSMCTIILNERHHKMT